MENQDSSFLPTFFFKLYFLKGKGPIWLNVIKVHFNTFVSDRVTTEVFCHILKNIWVFQPSQQSSVHCSRSFWCVSCLCPHVLASRVLSGRKLYFCGKSSPFLHILSLTHQMLLPLKCLGVVILRVWVTLQGNILQGLEVQLAQEESDFLLIC